MKTTPLVPPTRRAPLAARRVRLTVGRVLLAALCSFMAGVAVSYWKTGVDAPAASADVAPAAPAEAAPAAPAAEPDSGEAPAPAASLPESSLSSITSVRKTIPAPAAERLEPLAPKPARRAAPAAREREQAKAVAPRRAAERRETARKNRKADRDNDSDEAKKAEKRKDSKRKRSECAS